MNIKNFITNAGSKTVGFVSKYATQILTILGCCGVVGTAYVTAKATPKIMKTLEEFEPEMKNSEKVKALAPDILPVVLCGTATCAAIIGSNVISNKRYKELAVTTGVAVTTLNKWKDIVKEHIGEDEYNKIEEKAANERFANLDFAEKCIETVGRGDQLYIDMQTGKSFLSDPTYIKEKIADFKFSFTNEFDGVKSLNEFYSILGLKSCGLGDTLGWDVTIGNNFKIRFIPIQLNNGRSAIGLDYYLYPLNNRY